MKAVLEVSDLSVSFDTDAGRILAVDGVSFGIREGETLGLVGESGCGKSVTALSVLRLIPSPPGRVERGSIRFEGRDILQLSTDALQSVRGEGIGMIFQEPMTALSPLHRIGDQLVETVGLHRKVPAAEARASAVNWLKKVGVPDAEQRMAAYPHQLSGGMRQRVMIAMALMLGPRLLIADEPTTALDVTIQAQILELIRSLRAADRGVLLITHDMGVVWEMCDRVAVMYASQIVEEGAVDEVFARPLHPYAEALLKSMPALTREQGARLPVIPGQVPSPLKYPTGCRFRDRCPYAFGRCAEAMPPLQERGRRKARCFLADERGRVTS
jgi:peptide/nickel transport system ATP-binding protein/oligopeptide transport system ATP-binding protein